MRDRQLEIYELFEKDALVRVSRLCTDAVIDEHAANPAGPHSDALQRVLRSMRRAPVPGKYVIVAVQPWREYRIGVLTGVRGEAPVVLDDGPYRTEEEAMHGVFLKRVADIRSAVMEGAE
jgi:branched-chain amino acid transport system permease protein